MSDQAIARQIPVHERMEAISLIHADGRCHGAVVRNLMTAACVRIWRTATCIATGGFGRIYRVSTNAVINEGIGAAIALESGAASLGNMEAVQFHPTAIFPAGILVTEGCRGDGGLLRDRNEHRFMPDYEPQKRELASRDVVSRRMEQHIAAGHGASNRFGEHLWLDIRLLGETHINGKLREVKEICHYFLGIDPASELIPVRPAQHYSMGGIRTDHRGESPTLRGLFAAGEAACWDLHGFNRLGGNSVAETVVAGMLVGEYMADFCERTDDAGAATLARETLRHEASRLQAICSNTGGENPFALLREMQEIMTDQVGIFRNGDNLEHAVATLRSLLARSRDLGLRRQVRGANPELVAAYRVAKMLKLALCVSYGRAGTHREPRRPLPRGPPATQRSRLVITDAGGLGIIRGRHADAPLRAARCDGHGAATRLAWLWAERPYRASRQPTSPAAGRRRREHRRPLPASGRADALCTSAAGAVPRPQRKAWRPER